LEEVASILERLIQLPTLRESLGANSVLTSAKDLVFRIKMEAVYESCQARNGDLARALVARQWTKPEGQRNQETVEAWQQVTAVCKALGDGDRCKANLRDVPIQSV